MDLSFLPGASAQSSQCMGALRRRYQVLQLVRLNQVKDEQDERGKTGRRHNARNDRTCGTYAVRQRHAGGSVAQITTDRNVCLMVDSKITNRITVNAGGYFFSRDRQSILYN